MGWGEFVIGDVAHDLSHLDPFVMTVAPKAQGAPVYNVLVSFGSHTFTREVSPSDPVAERFVDGSDVRCFCPIRHAHSLNLPRIVRRASVGRAYFSQGRNLLCVDWLPGLEAPYAVFFNLVKSRDHRLDAAMFVVSAYAKPELPDRLPSVTFATLVSHVVAGHALVPPRDARSIKR